MSNNFVQPAFPTYEKGQSCGVDTGLDLTNSGMTLRDYFAIRAPLAGTDQITREMQRDANLNPHNDSHKPALRSRIEVICDLSYEYADAMMKARSSK